MNYKKIINFVFIIISLLLLAYTILVYVDFSLTMKYQVEHAKIIAPEEFDPGREKDIVFILYYLKIIIVFILLGFINLLVKNKKE